MSLNPRILTWLLGFVVFFSLRRRKRHLPSRCWRSCLSRSLSTSNRGTYPPATLRRSEPVPSTRTHELYIRFPNPPRDLLANGSRREVKCECFYWLMPHLATSDWSETVKLLQGVVVFLFVYLFSMSLCHVIGPLWCKVSQWLNSLQFLYESFQDVRRTESGSESCRSSSG